MESIPITNARNDLFNLAEKTIEYHTPVKITSKKGDVVMLSSSDWDCIQETLYLNASKDIRDSIINAMNAPLSEFVEDIGWDIN